jgi:hypothetical protein
MEEDFMLLAPFAPESPAHFFSSQNHGHCNSFKKASKGTRIGGCSKKVSKKW